MDYNDYLDYNPVTGILTWKNRPRAMFKNVQAFGAWNTKYAGQIAGYPNYTKSGYPKGIYLSIHKKRLLAHRIIWMMTYGSVPKGLEIDHKDCNPENNKLSNLRLATSSQNKWNMRTFRTPFKGVTLRCDGKKYVANLGYKGGNKYLGSFNTPEEAHAARCRAAKKYHKDFSRD